MARVLRFVCDVPGCPSDAASQRAERPEVADEARQAMLWGINNAKKDEVVTLGHWLPCGHYVAAAEVVAP